MTTQNSTKEIQAYYFKEIILVTLVLVFLFLISIRLQPESPQQVCDTLTGECMSTVTQVD